MSLKSPIRKLIWSLPRPILIYYTKIKFKSKFKISKYGNLIKISGCKKTSNEHIFIHHPERISRYLIGINARLELLGREYLLKELLLDLSKKSNQEFIKNHFIIDVGSNIGEFTLIAAKYFPNAKFIRFEPESFENLASRINTSYIDNLLIEKALFSEVKEVPFYHNNKTGDSSLFPAKLNSNSSEILTTTLDLEIKKLSIQTIFLLKIEAEGAEPEVLLGATNTLNVTKYVVVDVGPEIGVLKEETFNSVNSILVNSGFTLVHKTKDGRNIVLYKNMEFNS